VTLLRRARGFAQQSMLIAHLFVAVQLDALNGAFVVHYKTHKPLVRILG